MPSVSVCVVTYERATFLTRCLESLAEHAPGVEVVVVDASAADGRMAVQHAFPGALYAHRPDLAGWMTRSRNAALLHASGEIIAFLDDDVVVSSGWLAGLKEAFASTPFPDAVAGRTRNLQPGEDEYEHPIGTLRENGTLTAGFAAIAPGIIPVDHGIGANMAFRRTMLARLGGFRDDYPGTAMREDTDIFLRIKALGGRTVFAPDACVDHLPGPHVKGRRFDTRYKLYGRRNHVVLLARYAGLGSPIVRRWIAADLGAIGEAGGIARRIQRAGVSVIGITWGLAAAVKDARWHPLPPIRNDPQAARIRRALA